MTGHVPAPVQRYQLETAETAVPIRKRKNAEDNYLKPGQRIKTRHPVVDKSKITKSLTQLLPDHLKVIFQDHGVQAEKHGRNKCADVEIGRHNKVSSLQAPYSSN